MLFIYLGGGGYIKFLYKIYEVFNNSRQFETLIDSQWAVQWQLYIYIYSLLVFNSVRKMILTTTHEHIWHGILSQTYA